MEEEHPECLAGSRSGAKSLPNRSMTTLVNLEKVDQGVLPVNIMVRLGEEELTTEAAKDPFSHLRL